MTRALSETQTRILTAGAQRRDHIALPLPHGLHGAAAKMAVTRMINHGWLQEVDANLRRGEPLWLDPGDGHQPRVGDHQRRAMAIAGIEPMVASASASARQTKTVVAPTPDRADNLKPITIRLGTKQAQIIAMLQRPEGATIAGIVGATAWQSHTARGMISGALKKKLGLVITSVKEGGRGTVYRTA